LIVVVEEIVTVIGAHTDILVEDMAVVASMREDFMAI